VVKQVKEMGIHFTLHVVGMNVQPEDAEQLLCVARAGQGYYMPVQTAQEMNQALEKIEQHIAEGNEPVVAQLPTPTPIPPTPTSTLTPNPISDDRIIFISDRNQASSYELYSMNSDGSNQQQISTNLALMNGYMGNTAGSLSYSHVTNKVLIAGINHSLGYVDLTSPNDFLTFPLLKQDQGISSAKWSPDGRSIAYVRDGQVHIMNANGSNTRQITSGNPRQSTNMFSVDWSPDGQTLAVNYNYQLYFVNPVGSGRSPIGRKKGITDRHLSKIPLQKLTTIARLPTKGDSRK
jgi:WD40 repeat protein